MNTCTNAENKTIFVETVDGTIADLDEVITVGEVESGVECLEWRIRNARKIISDYEKALKDSGDSLMDTGAGCQLYILRGLLKLMDKEAKTIAKQLRECPEQACWKVERE